METVAQPPVDLRRLSTAEWARLGEESLREHLLAQAVVAHQKYAPLDFAKLDRLLRDPQCLRHPTRIVYEFGGMAMHQFAEPDQDFRQPDQDARVLYVRPLLRDHPGLVVSAVAYMIPLINYGGIVADDHCLAYGATLLGLMQEEFYRQVCDLADFVGAEPRLAGTASPCAPARSA